MNGIKKIFKNVWVALGACLCLFLAAERVEHHYKPRFQRAYAAYMAGSSMYSNNMPVSFVGGPDYE